MGSCMSSTLSLGQTESELELNKQINARINARLEEKLPVVIGAMVDPHDIPDIINNMIKKFNHALFSIITKDIINMIIQYFEPIKFNEPISIFISGALSNGKTTLLKQYSINYSNIKQDIIDPYRSYIRSGIIKYLKMLCRQSVQLCDEYKECESLQNQELVQEFVDIDLDTVSLNSDLIYKAKLLWDDIAIKNTWKLRHLYQYSENSAYFLDQLDEILDDDYKMSNKDYISVRMRTTGFSQEKINIITNKYQGSLILYDNGGARSERKKWLTMMHDDIHIIVYCIAISDYNRMCFEDNKTLRIHESYNLFNQMIKNGFMTNKRLILLFTKYDLFIEKIKRFPITDAFPEFPQNELNALDKDHVVQFLYDKFLQCLKENDIEIIDPITLYCVNLTDMENMTSFLNEFNDDIIETYLKQQMELLGV